MNAAACFRAAYADFKLIKTRGVVSISFELPVEQAQAALDVLGGMPVAATEVWCAVARLGSEKEVMPPATSKPTTETPPRQKETAGGAKQAFRDMRLPNQAGMLCAEVPFQRFLAETQRHDIASTDDAADYVRRYCGVASRSDIRPRCPSGDRWTRLVEEYRAWMHAPELA